VVEEPNDVLVDASHEGAPDDDHMLALSEEMVKTGLRIRIHFTRIRIQHFRLNTNTDPGL
jgi:hypothetical protein